MGFSLDDYGLVSLSLDDFGLVPCVLMIFNSKHLLGFKFSILWNLVLGLGSLIANRVQTKAY